MDIGVVVGLIVFIFCLIVIWLPEEDIDKFIQGEQMMIFQEIQKMFKKRQYAKIDAKVYQILLNEMYNGIKGYQFGEEYEEVFPQEYVDLRNWVYDRVAKDIIYQDGSYLNDHFCIGAIYGMLRICDDQTDRGSVWYDIFDKILNKE